MKGCENYRSHNPIHVGLAHNDKLSTMERRAFILGHKHMEQIISTEFNALQMASNIKFDPKLSAANIEYEVGD